MAAKTKPCPRCDGKGTINGMNSLDHTGPVYKEMKCPQCLGTKVVPVKGKK